MTALRRVQLILTRRAAALTALILLAAVGCVTVHGEEALVPSVDKTAAAKVIEDFTRVNNKANRDLDQKLNAQIETGALGAIDSATLKAQHARNPNGDPNYQPLGFTDPHFLIPKLRGWPKWFIADVQANRDKDSRWLLTFIRGGPDEPWKAAYLSVISNGQLPHFALDKQGYVRPAALDAADLLVQPAKLSSEYAGYLAAGKQNSAVFAAGPSTTALVQERAKQRRTSQYVTQFADQPADSAKFPPVALRTTDGGAAVFFASQHTRKVTFAQGYAVKLDSLVEALIIGTPERSVTTTQIAQQFVLVPAAGKSTAKVTFVDRLAQIVSARGE